MLTTSQPIDENHRLSARVEKRGPWMTTTVPRSWMGRPRALAAAVASSRRTGQYGCAVLTWTTLGPAAKKVSARPEVLSTNWSQTTKSPGLIRGCKLPAALGAITRVTPTDESAHRLAR